MTHAPVPKSLGRYTILRRLGIGGMAEVFLASSRGAEGTEKTLVVKRVLPTLGKNARFIALFVAEAKVAMRLNHPNVVQVYAFEQVRREFLLAMELVDGLDLKQLMKKTVAANRTIPPGLAAYIVGQVGRGADYSHRRTDDRGVSLEIVHRDISPQNVLIGRDGVVKLTDFGIAKARMNAEDERVVKGKFAYMSPEQASGAAVDARSDIFGLGMVLAELLVGVAAINSPRERSAGLPLRVEQIDASVPATLSRIIRRATQPDPEQRYPTSRDMVRELQAYLHQQEVLWDAELLEGFVQDVMPASETAVVEPREQATVVRPHEQRERRRVIRLHAEVASGVLAEATQRTLADIAFREDALVEWLGEPVTGFAATVGVGRAALHDHVKAIRLAVDAMDAVRADSEQALCCGLARGIVTTVRDGAGRLTRHQAEADMEAAALRCAEAAAPGTILATGEIQRLARRDAQFEASDRVAGHRAWKLIGLAADDVEPTHSESCVGREMELQQLQTLWDSCVSETKMVFAAVTGDVGVGKSTLLHELSRQLPDDLRTIFVSATYGSMTEPYGVARQMMCALLNQSAPTAVSLMGALSTLPMREERAESAKAALLALFELGPQQPPLVMRHGVLEVFYGTAQRSPLVLVLDAMEWCDAASMMLLRAAHQIPSDVPVMVLLGCRPMRRLSSVLSGVPQVELDELEPESVRLLLTQRFPRLQITAQTLEAVTHTCGGNPLFVVELVEAWIERGVACEQDGVLSVDLAQISSVPTTIDGVLMARIHELPISERTALRWFAVAGNGMTIDELRQLDPGIEERSPAFLVRRGLLVERGDAHVIPNHVVRSTAYESIDGPDRLRMHRQVADLLRERVAPQDRVGWHLERAGDSEAAARCFFNAGLDALRMNAHIEALALLTRVLTLLPEDASERLPTHEARATIFQALGDHDAQENELVALHTAAIASGDPLKLAKAEVRRARFLLRHDPAADIEATLEHAADVARQQDAGALEAQTRHLRLRSCVAQGRLGDAIGYGKRLLDDLKAAPPLVRAGPLAEYGTALHLIGDDEAALDAHLEAAVIFQRSGDIAREAFALHSASVSLAALARLEEALGLAERAIELDVAASHRFRLGRKLVQLGCVQAAIGMRDSADMTWQRAEDVFGVADDALGRAVLVCARVRAQPAWPNALPRELAEALSNLELAVLPKPTSLWVRLLRVMRLEHHDPSLARELRASGAALPQAWLAAYTWVRGDALLTEIPSIQDPFAFRYYELLRQRPSLGEHDAMQASVDAMEEVRRERVLARLNHATLRELYLQRLSSELRI